MSDTFASVLLGSLVLALTLFGYVLITIGQDLVRQRRHRRAETRRVPRDAQRSGRST